MYHRIILYCAYYPHRALALTFTYDVSPLLKTQGNKQHNIIHADAPRRRLTRAEYDAGLGDSDDFDDASDDEAYIHNPADHAPPSLVGSVASRG